MEICRDSQKSLSAALQKCVIQLIDGLVDHHIHHTDLHASNILLELADPYRFVAIDFADAKVKKTDPKSADARSAKATLLLMLLYDAQNGLIARGHLDEKASADLIRQLKNWGMAPPRSPGKRTSTRRR